MDIQSCKFWAKGPTDRPTDRVAYGVACTRLKSLAGEQRCVSLLSLFRCGLHGCHENGRTNPHTENLGRI